MKKLIILYSALALSYVSFTQDVNLAWAKQMGGASSDQGNSIAVDASGNVYTTGSFFGTTDFDPGPGTYNLTSFGSGDIFVSKLDASGNFLWAKQLGGADDDRGYSIAVDANGNVYTTGIFSGTADFDPGPGTYNLTTAGAGSIDAFISKLDAAGNFIWAKQLHGVFSTVIGNSIAVDADGNVYTTGTFYYPGADFDPGPGTYNLTPTAGSDIFVSKLDASGNFAWAKRIGGAGQSIGYSISVDAYANVYTTGYFQGTTDFDPGTGTYNLVSAGDWDIFVSKLSASGNFVWAKQMGGASYDVGKSISVDANGNVYTTGIFFGTVDFDPGTGTYNLSSASIVDIFVSKLDASGNFVWAKRLGGASDYDEGRSIAVDPCGNVYTTGRFGGTADFDPGTGIYNLTSSNYDPFVSKLDASGNFVWAIQFSGTGFITGNIGNSIAVDASGNVYTTGQFSTTTDFDPGAGTYNLSSAGDWDIFVVKLTCSFTYFRDVDGDGFGSSVTTTACSTTPPAGYVSITGDCNDNNPGINPNATEICGNNIDDNCDGQIDEGCPNKALLNINDATVYESVGSVTLTVTLSKKTDEAVSVNYKTVDGTARSKANKPNPADYIAKSGTVTIPAGSQTATISVIIIVDNVQESTEQFYVELSKPVNAGIGKSTGTVTILDGAPLNSTIVRTSNVQQQVVNEKQQIATEFILKAMPNPSSSQFTLKIESGNTKEMLNLRVVDVLGKVIEIKNNIFARQTLQIGKNYRPGVYFVEMTQGNDRIVLKLIKQTH